jgi:general secretion pathway protein C
LILLVALAAPPPDLTAVGIVLGPSPERSIAILQSGGRTRTLAVGETAFGGRVLRVTADVVTLDFDGEAVEVRVMPGVSVTAMPTPQAPAAAGAPRPPPMEDTGPQQRSMPRAELERRLAEEMSLIVARTVVRPVSEDGRVVGVQISRIPEGTILTEVGLRSGDVLTRLNDVEIDGLLTLLGLYPRLQTATQLRAEILREGRPVSLGLTIR